MGVYWGTVLSHNLRVGFGNRQLGLYPILTVLSDQWLGAACASSLYEGCVLYIITPSSLKKRDNSVGSVGSVGKSEKSPENSPRKVSQNAYMSVVRVFRIGEVFS